MRRRLEGRARIVVAFIVGAIVATAATAGAASLITGKQIKDGTISTKDLAKSVRKQLRRPAVAGATGPAGVQGSQGPAGKDGAQGPAGSFASVLPSGRTLKGAFYLTSAITSYSFASGLASVPTVRVRAFGSPASTECPGSAADPQAGPGSLCLYQSNNSAASACVFATDDPNSSCTSATKYGFSGSSNAQFQGQWAVTAP